MRKQVERSASSDDGWYIETDFMDQVSMELNPIKAISVRSTASVPIPEQKAADSDVRRSRNIIFDVTLPNKVHCETGPAVDRSAEKKPRPRPG
jgi:hypothetical protein